MSIREDFYNEICFAMITEGIETEKMESMKTKLQILMDKYEISERCTEIMELKQDRNEYLLKKFMIAKAVKGCTKRTLQLYGTEIPKILMKIGKTVDDIRPDDIRLYIARRLKEDKITKLSAGNEMRYLSSFYTYLFNEKLIEDNPMLRVDRIKKEKTKKEALTEIEIEKIRNACRDEREKAIIEVLLSTGCRVTELTLMRISELNGNKIIVHGKGEKERTVYLNAKAQIALENYLNQRTDTVDYLFPGTKSPKVMNKELREDFLKHTRDWWKWEQFIENKAIDKGTIEDSCRKMAKRAGVERANPHKFRRTCATMALKRGMPIEQVSKMLGHEDISTTQIYLDLSDDELEQYHKKYVM